MRLKLFISVAAIASLASCGKGSFETKPQIKIKSISGNVVPVNGNLNINLSYTDKEGDLSEGIIFYKPKRLNIRPYTPDYVPVTSTLPEYPKNPEGEIQLTFLWQNLHKSDQENDTISIRFAVTDKAGHASDTITTDKIVILKN